MSSSDEVVLVCAPSSVGGMETVLSKEGIELIKLPQHKFSSLDDVYVSCSISQHGWVSIQNNDILYSSLVFAEIGE